MKGFALLVPWGVWSCWAVAVAVAAAAAAAA